MASYRVEITDQAQGEAHRLPGNMRQRILRELRSLEQEPRPHLSRLLDATKSGIELAPGMELRRIRLAAWRVVYVIEEDWKLVSILAIRKRPPYQYEDLDKLVQNV